MLTQNINAKKKKGKRKIKEKKQKGSECFPEEDCKGLLTAVVSFLCVFSCEPQSTSLSGSLKALYPSSACVLTAYPAPETQLFQTPVSSDFDSDSGHKDLGVRRSHP